MFINSGVQTFREPFAALSRSFATAAKTYIHMCRCHSDTKSLAWVLERITLKRAPLSMSKLAGHQWLTLVDIQGSITAFRCSKDKYRSHQDTLLHPSCFVYVQNQPILGGKPRVPAQPMGVPAGEPSAPDPAIREANGRHGIVHAVTILTPPNLKPVHIYPAFPRPYSGADVSQLKPSPRRDATSGHVAGPNGSESSAWKAPSSARDKISCSRSNSSVGTTMSCLPSINHTTYIP